MISASASWSSTRSSVGGAAIAAIAATLVPSIARADDPPPAEVQVIAPHRDVGETTVRREDTRDVPGTFGDPTRIAEVLPGVVPTASGLQAFFVRGAPPTSTGTFIDGVPVPVLYHVGFGPSVVHPGLLDHVDFYQGAPPAQYGGYVGGVLSATTNAPADHPHGEANLRLFDAGALGETPFGDGKGSALVAARYGYPAVILPLFTSDTTLSYWDYQARVTYDVSDHDRIGAFVFGSYDQLNEVITPNSGPSFTQQQLEDQFHRVDLRWDRSLGAQSSLRVAATLGRDVVGNDAATAVDDTVRLRAELDTRPSREVRIRAGADAQYDALRQGPAPEGAISTNAPLVPSRDGVVWGVHADAAWRIAPGVEITPGVRAAIFDTRPVGGGLIGEGGATTTPVLEPRLAVRARILPGLTSVSTFGMSHQLLGIPAQYPSTSPDIQPGLQTGVMGSVQASQGVEVALPLHFSLATTAFLHDYSGLPDVTWQCQQPATGATANCVTPTVDGRAYGLEVLLRRSFAERLNVWISYTLSRSTRDARPTYAPASSAPTMTILSEYDRTHVLSAVVSYDFGHDWRAGARVFAYSGRPYTPVAGGTLVVPYDTQRLPGFFRLDARLEKAWMVGQSSRIAVVLEGINLTLNKETVDANCTGPGNSVGPGQVLNSCTFDTLGPITIPSIGVEGWFR
jgi:hypothetical protein